jgi:predicted nucleic acid-binding protein
MQLLISDTNIFIDLEVSGLTELMFQLPETFAVPDILYAEELAGQHSALQGLGLRILEIDAEHMEMAYRYRAQYSQTGQNDLFALALAVQEHCPLLTGDRRLREAAEQEAIPVHGTLWLMERLLAERKISLAEAKQAYERMRESGRRLPWDLVAEQMRRFKLID